MGFNTQRAGVRGALAEAMGTKNVPHAWHMEEVRQMMVALAAQVPGLQRVCHNWDFRSGNAGTVTSR